MIIVQTSLRISFVEGGTDFEYFYLSHSAAVLSTTIDKCVLLVLRKDLMT